MNAQTLEKLISSRGEEARSLHREADRVRHETVGDEVHLRALIEFSNHCRCHCRYCGLRADNTALNRYRMSPGEVLDNVVAAHDLGLRTVVLQSGEDLHWSAEMLAELIADIKRRTKMAITLSVGERPREDYLCWRKAGADRYLLKHETSDPDLYRALHPGAELHTRLNCLETLLELGYQVGSGCIVGLPGQTPAILARDLLLIRDLGLHMTGIGPLISHPATPLADCPSGDVEAVLNMMALLRLLVPDIMMPATTALETLSSGGRILGLQCGANVLMPNMTMRCYAMDYEIYPGKKAPSHSLQAELAAAQVAVAQAGRTIADGPGHSPRAHLAGRIR